LRFLAPPAACGPWVVTVLGSYADGSVVVAVGARHTVADLDQDRFRGVRTFDHNRLEVLSESLLWGGG
jgi:hypothetical protein